VAKLERTELTTATRTRKAMTFHDLRASGATWMAVRGDDPLKIMQRCGHADFQTTQAYVREAEAIREGFGDVFPPLPSGPYIGPTDSQVIEKIVEAPGIEPGSENALPARLRT